MITFAKPTIDRAYDIYRSEHQPLKALFAPETVAIIGATDRPDSVGRTLVWNLVSSPFGGTIFPVNLRRSLKRNSAIATAANEKLFRPRWCR